MSVHALQNMAEAECLPQASFQGCEGSIEASERHEADQQSIHSQVGPPVDQHDFVKYRNRHVFRPCCLLAGSCHGVT